MEMNVNRELIKELRLKKSWSQELLAEKAGVSMRTVQRIETYGVASLHSRAAIANAFEIEPAELDVEAEELVENRGSAKSQIRTVLLAVVYWTENTIRGISIIFLSTIGASMFAMALLKPFMASNVGLFTNANSTSFGIIGNTANMQEHLGYWVIPLAFLGGLVLFKGMILLARNRSKT